MSSDLFKNRKVGTDLGKLFTKEYILKKVVGKAHKGWKLERVKGSTDDDIQSALATAKDMIEKIIRGDGDDSAAGCTFIFSRRTVRFLPGCG